MAVIIHGSGRFPLWLRPRLLVLALRSKVCFSAICRLDYATKVTNIGCSCRACPGDLSCLVTICRSLIDPSTRQPLTPATPGRCGDH